MPDPTSVTITYCTQCRWLFRAAWLAQELLTAFEQELAGVTLAPDSGGVFEVRIGDERIFSRQRAGHFAEAAELKRLVRDRVAPGRNLGHSGPALWHRRSIATWCIISCRSRLSCESGRGGGQARSLRCTEVRSRRDRDFQRSSPAGHAGR
jgi:selenoprotein W-related protein